MHKNGNNTNIGIRGFITWKQKMSVTKFYPSEYWFQVQHYLFWNNLAFACKTETLGSLYSHALLILTKLSKSENQVVYGRSLKISEVALAKLVLKGEYKTWNQRSSGSILTGVTFCYWNCLFLPSKVSDAKIGIIANIV